MIQRTIQSNVIKAFFATSAVGITVIATTGAKVTNDIETKNKNSNFLDFSLPQFHNKKNILPPLHFNRPGYTTSCNARGALVSDVMMLGTTLEPVTKIPFPKLCNGMTFTGAGVRVKWHFVKVYAVGTYMDPVAMAAVKKESNTNIYKALNDPMYPRTIRIVLNRTVSSQKYLDAIVEALEPRMNGQDLDKIEEFKQLNPPGDMVEGSEVQMTIRGDSFLYRNAAGTVGHIKSEVFTRAICDLYYGSDPASPDHKTAVIEGIKTL